MGCWAAQFPVPLPEEACSWRVAGWFVVAPERYSDSLDDPRDGWPVDCWAAPSLASLVEEACLPRVADWFELVLECRGGLPEDSLGGLPDGSKVRQLLCWHSAPPARVALVAVEQWEADPDGSHRASQRALGPRRPWRRARCSQELRGARLRARFAALEQSKAVCRHCS